MGVLKDTKQVLGVDGDDHSFDVDITMHINSALMILRQTGALPTVSKIVDDTTTWEELFPPTNGLWAVQSYVYLRLIHRPTLSSKLPSRSRSASSSGVCVSTRKVSQNEF